MCVCVCGFGFFFGFRVQIGFGSDFGFRIGFRIGKGHIQIKIQKNRVQKSNPNPKNRVRYIQKFGFRIGYPSDRIILSSLLMQYFISIFHRNIISKYCDILKRKITYDLANFVQKNQINKLRQ